MRLQNFSENQKRGYKRDFLDEKFKANTFICIYKCYYKAQTRSNIIKIQKLYFYV